MVALYLTSEDIYNQTYIPAHDFIYDTTVFEEDEQSEDYQDNTDEQEESIELPGYAEC